MAGNAVTPKIGYYDHLTQWTGSGDTPGITVTTGGTAAGYSINNALLWDNSRYKSASGATFEFAIGGVYDGDLVNTTVNTLVIWKPEISTYESARNNEPLLVVNASTTALGVFDSIASSLDSGRSDNYASVYNSRCWILQSATSFNPNVSGLKITIVASGACQVSFAKIGLYNMQDLTNITGDIEYNFADRNIYNERENGGTSLYGREFAREVSWMTKYNSGTFALSSKFGYSQAQAVQNPIMLQLDPSSVWAGSGAGKHIHSFPARFQQSAQYTISPQYSTTGMYSSLPVTYSEYL